MKSLYKGKRVDNGEWIKGYLLGDEITGQYFIHASGSSVNESPKVGEEGVLHFLAFEVIPETVGRYAGLKDKNGEEIFGGDIIQRMVYIYPLEKNEPIGERMLTGVVTCAHDGENPEYWLIKSKDEHGNPTKYIFDNGYEIIGNVHDNPELLEVEA